MQDQERGNWIVFNGEIYNFRELKEELKGLGEVFHTNSDTEVMLRGYGVWGSCFVKRLRGIFAFGIWDKQRRSLLLARDPLGVKPMYLWRSNGNLLFASEVRAILATNLVERRLDTDALFSYLAYGSVQEPFTLVKGIRSLPAGCMMTWQNGQIEEERYWCLPFCEPRNEEDKADIIEKVRDALTDAVKTQLISDVPLGVFLSGGIDSTAIAALMQKANLGPVRAFSVVFREQQYDERKWSRLASRYIGAEHTEVELSGEMVKGLLPAAIEAYDQPSMDGLNTWFVSKFAKESGLTVALSGLGGDELFGGYDGYSKALMAERSLPLSRMVPKWARGPFAKLVRKYGQNEALRKAGEMLVLKRHPYFLTRRLFGDWQLQGMLADVCEYSTAWSDISFERIESAAALWDPINRASAFELQTYMLSTLLRDTDQMSMAHALEVRVPLIDHRLVELLFTIPGRFKLDKRQPKPLLTLPLRDLLPAQCVHRPKYGFTLPFQIWLKDALQGHIRDSFLARDTSDSAYPFSTKSLKLLWENFHSGRVNWSRVWAVFMLQTWLKQHRVV